MKQIERDILSLGMLLMENKEVVEEVDREKIVKLYEEYFSEENIDEKMKEYYKELYSRIKKKLK